MQSIEYASPSTLEPTYRLTVEQIEFYHAHGYVSVDAVMPEGEIPVIREICHYPDSDKWLVRSPIAGLSVTILATTTMAKSESIRTLEEALEYVQIVKVCTLFSNKIAGLPSLWDAADLPESGGRRTK